MKITCTVDHLKTAVLTSERFTGKHITLPILSHLLFKTQEQRIIITATNLETGIEFSIPGKVQKTGSVTAPAKSLSYILQSLSDETITLEADKQVLTLHTPSSDVTITGLNAGDFPHLPKIEQEHSFRVYSSVFTEALKRVLVAAATSEIKPELAGVYINTSPGTVVFAATDSFRLSEYTVANIGEVSSALQCIIPARTVQEVLRTLPDDTELEIAVGEHQVVFQWDRTRILSRLIDGAYPPYKNLIPQSYETSLVVSRDDMIKKIRLASVFSSRLNDVTLRYTPSELEVTTNGEAGGTSARIVTKVRGKTGSILFNYRYLLDGIEAAGGEHVILNFNNSSGPALIQNPSNPAFLYILMPIRAV